MADNAVADVPPAKPWTHYRGKRANAVMRGDAQAAEEALRDMRAARAEEYIEALVASAPPLTDEQKRRLAGLLLPVDAA